MGLFSFYPQLEPFAHIAEWETGQYLKQSFLSVMERTLNQPVLNISYMPATLLSTLHKWFLSATLKTTAQRQRVVYPSHPKPAS